MVRPKKQKGTHFIRIILLIQIYFDIHLFFLYKYVRIFACIKVLIRIYSDILLKDNSDMNIIIAMHCMNKILFLPHPGTDHGCDHKLIIEGFYLKWLGSKSDNLSGISQWKQ